MTADIVEVVANESMKMERTCQSALLRKSILTGGVSAPRRWRDLAPSLVESAHGPGADGLMQNLFVAAWRRCPKARVRQLYTYARASFFVRDNPLIEKDKSDSARTLHNPSIPVAMGRMLQGRNP